MHGQWEVCNTVQCQGIYLFSRLVHSVYILLVRPLDLLPLELEGGGDEAGVGQPGRGLQRHAGRHLELLQPVLPPILGQSLGHRLEYELDRGVNKVSRIFAIFRASRVHLKLGLLSAKLINCERCKDLCHQQVGEVK